MKTFIRQHRKNVIIAAVATLAFVSAAEMAQAADVQNDRPALTVRYSDLTLNTQAGIATLYNRIRNAAEQVCGKADSRRLEEIAALKACVAQAMSSSVNAVDSPQLTREYSARSGATSKQVVVASLN